MSTTTAIEWTDATWNPVRGCAKVSEGCRNCYAMRQAHRHAGPGGAYAGLTGIINGRPQWTGKAAIVRQRLVDPLEWRKPRRIFVNSMSDLFHADVPDWFIASVFAIMARAHWHTFQVLTKRPERARAWFANSPVEQIMHRQSELVVPAHLAKPYPIEWPLPNLWLGVSAEDQNALDTRAPILLEIPAAIRWISAEPLLGPIDLDPWLWSVDGKIVHQYGHDPRFHWLVAGGESGPGARPMHPDWPRKLRDQCAAGGVPFFFKQWGEWAPQTVANSERAAREALYVWNDGRAAPAAYGARNGAVTMQRVGKKAAGRLLDSRTWDQYPR